MPEMLGARISNSYIILSPSKTKSIVIRHKKLSLSWKQIYIYKITKNHQLLLELEKGNTQKKDATYQIKPHFQCWSSLSSFLFVLLTSPN